MHRIPRSLTAVADRAELTQARDTWGHQMLREGKYTPGQVDTKWTPEMIKEFNTWAQKRPQSPHVARALQRAVSGFSRTSSGEWSRIIMPFTA